jgi:hypothetical protein
MDILTHIQEKIEEPKRAPLFLSQSVLKSINKQLYLSSKEDMYRSDAQKRIQAPPELIEPLP